MDTITKIVRWNHLAGADRCCRDVCKKCCKILRIIRPAFPWLPVTLNIGSRNLNSGKEFLLLWHKSIWTLCYCILMAKRWEQDFRVGILMADLKQTRTTVLTRIGYMCAFLPSDNFMHHKYLKFICIFRNTDFWMRLMNPLRPQSWLLVNDKTSLMDFLLPPSKYNNPP